MAYMCVGECVKPLVQIVTGSALGVRGAMPEECQVPAFLCLVCKRGAKRAGPLPLRKCGIRTSPGLHCLKDYSSQLRVRVSLKHFASLRCAAPKSFPQGSVLPHCSFSQYVPEQLGP